MTNQDKVDLHAVVAIWAEAEILKILDASLPNKAQNKAAKQLTLTVFDKAWEQVSQILSRSPWEKVAGVSK